MENRFQYIFLKSCLSLLLVFFCGHTLAQTADASRSSVRSEFLEMGINAGWVNIEDFGNEFAIGAGLTFRATEDFFLQINYMQTDEVELSTAETEGPTVFIASEERDFKHYDLLLGVNIFQGEFFVSDNKANLSALYGLVGVGETEFGGENRFTYTLGLGYQIAFQRRYIVRFDIRDYIYDSSLIAEDASTHNFHMSAGISYLF
jgi:outer membrane beta-barrel protein